MARNNGTTAVVENVNVENVDVDENEVNELAFTADDWTALDAALTESGANMSGATNPDRMVLSFSCEYMHPFAVFLREKIAEADSTNANYVMMALARRSGFDIGENGENLPSTRGGKSEYTGQEIAWIKAAIIRAVNVANFELAKRLSDRVPADCTTAIEFGKSHARTRKNGKVATK